MPLRIDTLEREGAALLRLCGDAVCETAPQLKSELREQVATQPCIIVDLTRTEFLDEVGLGMLLFGLERARLAGGVLLVVCDSPRINRILEITGVSRKIDVFPTDQEALEALRKQEA